MASNTAELCITEDEAKLYDRQIRLWGLDAQKRLRAAKVLIVGMTGLGCEVAKNLVLAGVNSLTVMDHENLTEDDFSAQFLAVRASLGLNRATSSKPRLQALNPMVVVTADTSNIAEVKKEFFESNFDIVIVTHCVCKDVLVRINRFCRESGIKFFSGDVFGFFGYCFMDLLDHEYVEEVAKISEDDISEKNGGPPAKKAKAENGSGQNGSTSNGDAETKMVKHTMKFCSLEDALSADWTQEKLAKRIKRMDPSFFILQMILEFQSREGCSPNVAKKEKDLELLSSLLESIVQKYELPENKLPAEVLPLLFSELSPVAAIVGGILAQEVIKTISNKDAPFKNFFFYNPADSCGVVESIGC